MIKPLKESHIRTLLSLVNYTNFLETRNRAIILVFLDTGLRLSELTRMQVTDVYNNDLTDMKSEFHIMGKGAKERMVAISRTTQKAINQYMKLRKSDLPQLWLTEERRPLKPAGIYMALRRLGWAAGITDVRFNPHAYRHTAGTEMLRPGANVFQVQDLLGHSTQAMTKRYTATLNSEDAAKAHVKFSPVSSLKGI
jgi:integrase/recombinase XerC